MSIFRKIEIALGLALVIAVALLAVEVAVYRYKAAHNQETARVATGDARAATVYVKAYKEVQQQREVKNGEVEAVLEGNRDWSDAPLPDDVADLLRNGAGTTRAVP